MKIPSFFKTIRFRLTLWYSAFLVLILSILVIGIYTIYSNSRPPVGTIMPFPPSDSGVVIWRQTFEDQRAKDLRDLRNYSLEGVGAVLVLGAVGGYILSGFMLKPVDRVTALASRISHTNLKERIQQSGPEDEVKRLADTFDGMLGRLESAFESQKQFIQDASHELRTPIAIAQTNIEVLEMEKESNLLDYKKLVELIKSNLERMNDVSGSLLLLSEGKPPASKMARVEVGALVKGVYAENVARARSAGIDLEIKTPEAELTVLSDELRLKQAVGNLVDNAIKYNHLGGSVILSAFRENSQVVLQVGDTGIGISPEDLKHVFDRFFRVDKSRSRECGGSGLGLAIVKKIVEDLGGTVSAESVADKGSTFRILLPVSTA